MVPIPAMSMQFCSSRAVSITLKGWPLYTATEAMMISGAMLATNMASTCWRPKGIAFATGTRPSS